MLLRKDLNRQRSNHTLQAKRNKLPKLPPSKSNNKENTRSLIHNPSLLQKTVNKIDNSSIFTQQRVSKLISKQSFDVKDISTIFISKEDFFFKRSNPMQNLEKRDSVAAKLKFKNDDQFSTPTNPENNLKKIKILGTRFGPMNNLECKPALKKRPSLFETNFNQQQTQILTHKSLKRVKKRPQLLMKSQTTLFKKSFVVYKENEVFSKGSNNFLKKIQPTEVDNDVISDCDLIQDEVEERTNIFCEALRRYSLRTNRESFN